MFINTPRKVMELSESFDELTDDGRHYLLRMRSESAEFLLENADLQPTGEDYEKAAEFMSEISGVEFSSIDAKRILSLYPAERINLASHGAASSSSELAFALAHLLLGCSWPNCGDGIDMEKFAELLAKQAESLGFRRKAC